MNKYYLKVILSFVIIFLLLFNIKANASLPLQGKLIVIDPGHGGADPGTIHQDIYEKDINLKISLYLEEELAKLGASSLLLRDGDYDLSNGVNKHRKKTDFDNRIKIINASKADIYLSIHLNYLTNTAYYGAQVFYDKDNKNIAQNIQTYLNENLDTDRLIKEIPSTTYMYKKLNIPGVLIECGFLSNKKEREMLITQKYQKQIAQVIAHSLIDYFY